MDTVLPDVIARGCSLTYITLRPKIAQRKLNHEEIADKPQTEKHSTKNKNVGLENCILQK